jgi:hypothetical protein
VNLFVAGQIIVFGPIGPNIMFAAVTQKPPAELLELLFKVPASHELIVHVNVYRVKREVNTEFGISTGIYADVKLMKREYAILLPRGLAFRRDRVTIENDNRCFYLTDDLAEEK